MIVAGGLFVAAHYATETLRGARRCSGLKGKARLETAWVRTGPNRELPLDCVAHRIPEKEKPRLRKNGKNPRRAWTAVICYDVGLLYTKRKSRFGNLKRRRRRNGGGPGYDRSLKPSSFSATSLRYQARMVSG